MRNYLALFFVLVFISGCEEGLNPDTLTCDTLRKSVYDLVGTNALGREIEIFAISGYEQIPYGYEANGTEGIVKCKGIAHSNLGKIRVVYEAYIVEDKVFVQWRHEPLSWLDILQ